MTAALQTPTALSVPKSDAAGKLDIGWLDLPAMFAGILDTEFRIVDAADATKKFAVEIDAGMTANKTVTLNIGAQTDDRTLSVPVLAGADTLMTLATVQSVIGLKSFQDSALLIVGSSDATKTLKFEVDAQSAGADLTINTGAQTVDRTLSVPVLAGNDTIATLAVANTFTAVNTFSGATDGTFAGAGNIVNGGGMYMAGSLYATKTVDGGAVVFQFTNPGTGNAFTQITAAQANGTKYVSLYYINDTFSSSGAYQAGSGVIEVQGGSNGLGIYLRNGGPLKIYDSGATAQVTFGNTGILTLANTTDSTTKDTGSIVTEGGIGAEKQITAGTGFRTGSTTLMTSSVALTNGAAAAAGTLLNAPAAGNPTKWIPINDNGTTRYIPAW